MKNYYLLIIIAALLCSCSNKENEQKHSNQLIFQLDSTESNSGIQKLQASSLEQNISVNGKNYILFINRTPSDSLPSVKSESGIFYDNKIVVKIIDSTNRKNIFSKTFTKKTFQEYLNDDFKKNAILEGVVFDSEKSKKDKNITLAASISFPLSDLYIPFTIKIVNGSIANISKDDNFYDIPEQE